MRHMTEISEWQWREILDNKYKPGSGGTVLCQAQPIDSDVIG